MRLVRHILGAVERVLDWRELRRMWRLSRRAAQLRFQEEARQWWL